MAKKLAFSVEKTATGSSARACTFRTRRGTIVQTPIFMPVATVGAFRGIKTEDVSTLQFPIILSNTFHLFLRPGGCAIESHGGIQQMMQWENSVLTDSGGFQLFSLSKRFVLSEEGANVCSFVDGKWHLFSPEVSIQTQHQIGSDVLMVLDHCVPSMSAKDVAQKAVELSARWAKRSFKAHGDHSAALFGIVQGACELDLRKISAELTCAIDFNGFAIGGLAVGEEKTKREEIIEFTANLLPKDLPRYLMGVGTPIDILEAVHRGIDLFDCIIPTAFGQQGEVFTSLGKLSLRRSIYKNDQTPLDPDCICPACSKFSRAYLHHLIKCKESVGQALCGLHNLTFYRKLCSEMRAAILADTFAGYYKTKREQLILVDGDISRRLKVKKKSGKALGDYQLKEKNGANFIAQISSGEVMHVSSEPNIEAKKLYVEMSGLKDALAARRLDSANAAPLVIWDVGLGAAFNAMAVISEIETLAKIPSPTATPIIDMISFENDLDSLKLALKHKSFFPHLWHASPEKILNQETWVSDTGTVRWKLILGDFVETFNSAPCADFVLFDMFSQKSNAAHWGVRFFEKLLIKMNPRATFVTYSQATSVRAALLGAGFHVGMLPGIPPKEGHTIAWKGRPDDSQSELLLSDKFLKRWHLSHTKYPVDVVAEIDQQDFKQRIESHIQWA